jgi:hypothetical protein
VNEDLNSLKILSNDTASFEIFVVSFLNERGKLWIIRGMIRRGENEVLEEIIVHLPLCPSPIQYGLVWTWISRTFLLIHGTT